MTVTPLSENAQNDIKEIQRLAKLTRGANGTDAIEYTPACFVRHLGNGFVEIIVDDDDDEPKIIDGRNDRTRRMDREIEAWHARQAWNEAVKKYDKAF